jgi:hypothetical protein
VTIHYIDHGQVPFLALISRPWDKVGELAVYRDGTVEDQDSIVVTVEDDPVTAFQVVKHDSIFRPEYLKSGYSLYKMNRVLVGSVLNPEHPAHAAPPDRKRLWVV